MKDEKQIKNITLATFYYSPYDAMDLNTLITQWKRKIDVSGLRDILINFGTSEDGEVLVILNGKRLETDEEFEHRLKQIDSLKKIKLTTKKKLEQQERAEYERLKKKYDREKST